MTCRGPIGSVTEILCRSASHPRIPRISLRRARSAPFCYASPAAHTAGCSAAQKETGFFHAGVVRSHLCHVAQACASGLARARARSCSALTSHDARAPSNRSVQSQALARFADRAAAKCAAQHRSASGAGAGRLTPPVPSMRAAITYVVHEASSKTQARDDGGATSVPLHDVSWCASRGAAAHQHALAHHAAQSLPYDSICAPGRHTRRLPPLSGCLCPGRCTFGAAAAVPAIRSVSPLFRRRLCTAARRCWRIQPKNPPFPAPAARVVAALTRRAPSGRKAVQLGRQSGGRSSNCRRACSVPRTAPAGASRLPKHCCSRKRARALTRADAGAAPPAALHRLNKLANTCRLRRPSMAAPSSCWKRCLRAPPQQQQPQGAVPRRSSRLYTLNKRSATTGRADTSCGPPPQASWCRNGAHEKSDGHNRRRERRAPPPPHRAAASACREVRTPGGASMHRCACAVLAVFTPCRRGCSWRAARRTRGPCGARSSRCYIEITRRRG